MAELEKIKVDELLAYKPKIDLVRTTFRYLVNCHSHLWHLTVICRDAKRIDDALYFSTLVFKKVAQNVSHGGGRFTRYGGTEPFLTDTAFLFFRYGRWLVGLKDNKENPFIFEEHLKKNCHRINCLKLGMRDHLVRLAGHSVDAAKCYESFNKSGYSFNYDMPNSPIRLIADNDHYKHRSAMLINLANYCVNLISRLDELEDSLDKAPPKP